MSTHATSAARHYLAAEQLLDKADVSDVDAMKAVAHATLALVASRHLHSTPGTGAGNRQLAELTEAIGAGDEPRGVNPLYSS